MRYQPQWILAGGLILALGLTGIIGCEQPREDEESTDRQFEAAEVAEETDDEPETTRDGPTADEHPAVRMEHDFDDLDPEIPDEDIHSFGSALEAVEDLEEQHREEWRQRLREASDQQEMKAAQQSMVADVQRAIEDQGINFRRFVMIQEQLGEDPELRQRVADHLGIDVEEMEPDTGDSPGVEDPGAPGGVGAIEMDDPLEGIH